MSERLLHQYEAYLSQLPSDWEIKEISKLGKVVGGGTPSRDVDSFWKGPLPWVTPGEVSKEKDKVLYDTQDHISVSGLASSGANLLPINSLMITTRATIGARAINAVPMATNQGFKSVVFKETADAGFYFYQFEKVKSELFRRASGTTFLEISGSEFSYIPLPCPISKEKALIVQILDILDTTILQTETIISKLQQVTQGLLQDLLTRGIEANGELRLPVEVAPHLYQDSPLGWVPKEWEVVRLKNEVDIQHGFAFAGHLFTNEPIGLKLLVPGNFHRDGGLYFTSDNTKYFAGKYPKETILRNGDVLIVMTDLSPMTLILGKAVLLNEIFPVLHNQRVGKFIFKKQHEWNPQFFVDITNDDRLRMKVIAEATGTTVRHTSPDRIMSGFIVKPSTAEQGEISKRLITLRKRISAENMKLDKYKKQKSGLMDDLLTGRVRVTPLLKGSAL